MSDPQVFEVNCLVTVRITVRDPSAITRCTENVDGWRDNLYDLQDRDEVLHHWAFNAVVNGRRDGHNMDGWADLEPDDLTFDVERHIDVLDITEGRTS